MLAEVENLTAAYEDAVADTEDVEVISAAGDALNAGLNSLLSACQPATETVDEETEDEDSETDAVSGELIPAAEVSIEDIQEGLWRVVFGTNQNQCPGDSPIQSPSRELIITVDLEAESFFADDIFIYRPFLDFSRVQNGEFAFNRNMTDSAGVPYTYEYRIVEISPTTMRGVITNYFPSINCTLRDEFQYILVDPEIVCLVGASNGGNVRAQPDANSNRVRSLGVQERIGAVGRAQGADGFDWYQLSDGGWVRSDVVESAGYCDDLPEITP